MWWLITAAMAADPSAGMVLPGAGDVPVGFVEVGGFVGGAVFPVGSGGAGLLVAGARGAGSPVSGVVVSGGVGFSGVGIYSVGGAARGLLLDRADLRLGLAVTGGAFVGPNVVQEGAVAGVVVFETGVRKRFDVALPVVVVVVSDFASSDPLQRWLYTPLLASELGYTAPLSERSSLRFGKDAAGFGLAYRYDTGRVSFEGRLVGAWYSVAASIQVSGRVGR